ncbi:SH3 domain-containing protein [Nitrosomonas ureae]|uniref:SH3 domain-containing protein n=2 Tax=Nitrosomonas ureae TaxID=44577 RepID=A0A2T5IVA8_9PROT|nr:SH3 domain-containing protein [Nitrosomonas ureae]
MELEDSPLLKAMREMEESPLLRAARNIQDSPILRAAREINDSPLLRVVMDIENSALSIAAKQILDTPSMKLLREIENSSVHRLINALEGSPSMDAFQSAAEKIRNGFGAISLAQAYDLLTKEYDDESEGSADRTFDSLSDNLKERVKRAPVNPLSYEFYLQLILALVLFYLSHVSSREAELRLFDRIDDLEQAFTAQMQSLKADETNHDYFVVEANLNLRSGPGLEYGILVVLAPNLIVIGLERSGVWVRIEYFDYLNNLQRTGWVDARYIFAIAD